ncbi:mucin-5AC-like isoform X2 [Scylla paramamosain]|uniref:mucin-5AC-like isoform X2 n=1 Tax=Scylla paramamosain TaxID=85552 RepID=UPI0030827B22
MADETAPSTTAPSTTQSTTAPSTTTPSTSPSTTTPSTSPSTTAPSTTPSTTAPSTTAPSTTAPSMTPSSTPLATATAGLSEEVSSNTQEEDKAKRETDKREPKNEETQRLQRSEKTVDGAKRRGYPKKKPHGAGVKREATPSVSVTAFWACYGLVDLCLLPVNRKQAPHVVETDCLFNKDISFVIVNQFMLWENVLNPHHGYIEDDAVTFKVRLRTAPPYVINWSSDRLVRAPTQTLTVLPPRVTSGRKDEDRNSDVDENDSDDNNDDEVYDDDDSDDEDMNKDEGLYAQKNLHMYI